MLTETRSLQLSAPLPLSRHPARVYLRSLSPGSRPTMEGSLSAIASLFGYDLDTLDWAALTYQQTAAIQASLLERYAPATAKKMVCALRRVLSEAYKLKLMNADDYENAIALPPIKDRRQLRGRALTGEEISLLMRVCADDPTPKGKRDAALTAILRGAGLRRAEVVKLAVRDLTVETGALEVRQGKGGKDRTVYLPSGAIAYVEDWLEIRGMSPGALLCPVRKGGKIVIKHLSPQSVLYVLQKRAKQAGVKAFSPHDFRRTFCSDLLDAGTDIVTVQKLAGHSSPTTTAKYDRRGEETKRKAVQVLGF